MVHSLGVIENGVEPVGNREHCTVLKLSSDRPLDEVISFKVNCSSCFIKNKDLGFPEQGTRQTHQLTLANTGTQTRSGF